MQSADNIQNSPKRKASVYSGFAGAHESIKGDTERFRVSHFRPVKLALAALFMCVIMMCAGCQEKTGKGSDTVDSVTERPLPTLTPGATEEGDRPTAYTAENEKDKETGIDETDTAENAVDIATGAEENDSETGDMGSDDTAGTGSIQEKKQVLLYINEVLPTNSKYSKHHGGYYDVVELYNASEETVLLSDYYLSDSRKKLTDYLEQEGFL